MALTVPVSEIVEKTRNSLLSAHESWSRVCLGEIADVINGFAFKSSQFSNAGGLPLVRIRDVGKSYTETNYIGEYDERYLVRPGDFLVGMDGDFNCARWRGSVALLNQRVCKIVVKDARYSERFLDFVLPGYLKAINDVTSSVTVKHLSSKTIQQIPLPFPPLSIQEKIADELAKQSSRLDEAVANLKRVKANLKRYKASVLKAAVEGRLVETEAEMARREGRDYETGEQLLERILETRRKEWKGKGKYKEPAAPDTTGLPELPEGWVWCGFEQVSMAEKHALKAGPFGSALKKEFYVESGYKIYGQEQVIRGDHTFGDYFIDEMKYQELENCAVKPGDLLISLVGTAGKVLVLPPNAVPGIINPRLLKLSLNKTYITPEYATYMLQSSLVAHYFKLQAHGGTMEILNLGIVKALPVPLPPLCEQYRVVAEIDRRFSLIREVENQVDANLVRSDRMRHSILELAFSGQIVNEKRDLLLPEPAQLTEIV